MSTHPDSTPPTAPAGAALPVPTAEPCLSCGTTGGYTSPRNVTPDRKRGLCDTCYGQHYRAGTYKAFALIPESFEGFPPGYTHEPTGWPIVPAFTAAPPLPARPSWQTAIPLSRTEQAWIQRRSYVREIGRIERKAA